MKHIYAAAIGFSLSMLTARNAAAFDAGDILVDFFTASKIERLSSSGTLLQSFSTGSGAVPNTGSGWLGATLTMDGNLVTTSRFGSPTVYIFSPGGSLLNSFTYGGVSVSPGDVGVFANNTLAIATLNSTTLKIFNTSGALLTTTTLTGFGNIFGVTVGSDNIFYASDLNNNQIGKVDQNGTFLGTITTNFRVGDLVMNPLDGTLWAINRNGGAVVHLTTSGTILGSFTTGLGSTSEGIALAADNNSIYVTSETATTLKQYSLTGTLLNTITLDTAEPGFITVVSAPEPSSALLFGLSAAGLALRRRRRK